MKRMIYFELNFLSSIATYGNNFVDNVTAAKVVEESVSAEILVVRLNSFALSKYFF